MRNLFLIFLPIIIPASAFAGGSCAFGDVTCDGTINVQDVQCVAFKAVFHNPLTHHADQPKCMKAYASADVNCDGIVNITDVMQVSRWSLGFGVGHHLDKNQDNFYDSCHQPCNQANECFLAPPKQIYRCDDNYASGGYAGICLLNSIPECEDIEVEVIDHSMGIRYGVATLMSEIILRSPHRDVLLETFDMSQLSWQGSPNLMHGVMSILTGTLSDLQVVDNILLSPGETEYTASLNLVLIAGDEIRLFLYVFPGEENQNGTYIVDDSPTKFQLMYRNFVHQNMDGSCDNNVTTKQIATQVVNLFEARPFIYETNVDVDLNQFNTTELHIGSQELFRVTIEAEGGEVHVKKFSLSFKQLTQSELFVDTCAVYDESGNFKYDFEAYDNFGKSLMGTTPMNPNVTALDFIHPDGFVTIPEGGTLQMVLRCVVVWDTAEIPQFDELFRIGMRYDVPIVGSIASVDQSSLVWSDWTDPPWDLPGEYPLTYNEEIGYFVQDTQTGWHAPHAIAMSWRTFIVAH